MYGIAVAKDYCKDRDWNIRRPAGPTTSVASDDHICGPTPVLWLATSRQTLFIISYNNDTLPRLFDPF